MDNSIFIDDRDPAVQYVGGWFTGGVAEEFDSTTHAVSADGAQAILKFTGKSTAIPLSPILKAILEGTSVAVYGTLHAPDTPGISTYSIDGKSSTTTGATSNIVLYQQILYQSPQLADGVHTLTITPIIQPGGFWLDYFSIAPNRVTSKQPPSHAPTPAPTPAPTSSTTARPSNGLIVGQKSSGVTAASLVTKFSSITTSVTVTESRVSTLAPSSDPGVEASPIIPSPSTDAMSPTQVPPPASGVKPVHRTAIIVGSVLGGILFLLIVAFFVWRGSRRRNNSHCMCCVICCVYCSHQSPVHRASTDDTPVASPMDTSR